MASQDNIYSLLELLQKEKGDLNYLVVRWTRRSTEGNETEYGAEVSYNFSDPDMAVAGVQTLQTVIREVKKELKKHE